jgi:hypothetical protein
LLSSFLVGAFPRVAAAPAAHAATISVCAKAKKSVLIVNTNSGGHAVIGFYFAKELLAVGACHHCAHRRGGEGSDKIKKQLFSRFSVNPFCANIMHARRQALMNLGDFSCSN